MSEQQSLQSLPPARYSPLNGVARASATIWLNPRSDTLCRIIRSASTLASRWEGRGAEWERERGLGAPNRGGVIVGRFSWRLVISQIKFILITSSFHCTCRTGWFVLCLHARHYRRQTNYSQPFFSMAFALLRECIYGKCAHEQHVRRTLTITLTLTHTITAYWVSGNVVRVRILICATRQKRCRKRVHHKLLQWFWGSKLNEENVTGKSCKQVGLSR